MSAHALADNAEAACDDQCHADSADTSSLSDLLSAQSAQIRSLHDQLRFSVDSLADDAVPRNHVSSHHVAADEHGSDAAAAPAAANRKKHRKQRRRARAHDDAVDPSADDANAAIPMCVVPDDATLSSVAASIETTLNGVLSRLHSEFSISALVSPAKSSRSTSSASVSQYNSAANHASAASSVRSAPLFDVRNPSAGTELQSNSPRCATPLLPTRVPTGSNAAAATSASPLRNSNRDESDSDLEENIQPHGSGQTGAFDRSKTDFGSHGGEEKPSSESELAALWKTIRAAERKVVNAERAQARELSTLANIWGTGLLTISFLCLRFHFCFSLF